MIKIVGHWELSWSSPVKEIEQWSFPLREFGVSEIWMHPISGVTNNDHNLVQLHERKTLKELLEADGNKDLPRVYLEPQSVAYPHDGIQLPDFEHPEDCLYIFGSNHMNPMLYGFREGIDKSVIIPTVNNKGVLWSHQAMVITLYDRLMKG